MKISLNELRTLVQEIIKEEQEYKNNLSKEEENTVKDILDSLKNLNESKTINLIQNKLKKGLLTLGVISSLLSNPAIAKNPEAKSELEKAKIELSRPPSKIEDNEEIEMLEEIPNYYKKEVGTDYIKYLNKPIEKEWKFGNFYNCTIAVKANSIEEAVKNAKNILEKEFKKQTPSYLSDKLDGINRKRYLKEVLKKEVMEVEKGLFIVNIKYNYQTR
jgi:hypothetical protein